MNSLRLIAALVFFWATGAAGAGDNLKAFPPAEEGMVRFVLQVSEQEDESLFKVELIIGKTVQVDERNQYFFGGKIDKQTITGWGFPRYVVSELGMMGGTLMAIDPDKPKVDRFIRLGGEPYIIRYNSRLPVVVYVPEDAEVRYRIWTTGAVSTTMDRN